MVRSGIGRLFCITKRVGSATSDAGLPFLKKRLTLYGQLMRYDKPAAIGCVAAPGLWTVGLLGVAGALPDPVLVAKFALGGFFSRTAGCVINDYIDMNIDNKVERTQTRPLASRQLTKKEGIALALLNLSAAFGIVCTMPIECVYISFLAAAGMTLYPFCKRYFPLPGIVLSVSNSLGVPIAFKAMNLPLDPLMISSLMIGCTLYTFCFDAIFSYADKKDDIKINIGSAAQFFGDKYGRAAISSLLATSTCCLAAGGILADQTYPYFLSLGVVSYIYYKNCKKFVPTETDKIYGIFSKSFDISVIVFVGAILGTLFKKSVDKETETNTQELLS